MSRLDSFIRRLTAQRDCLDAATALVADRPGPVLELGLGNGRTYDHLLSRLPDRAVYVFERQVNAYAAGIPPSDRLVLGDLRDTLPGAASRIGVPAVLAHADIGAGDAATDAALAAFVSRHLPPLMAPGAVILCDQPLDLPDAAPLPLPPGVAAGRYYMWRLAGDP